MRAEKREQKGRMRLEKKTKKRKKEKHFQKEEIN